MLTYTQVLFLLVVPPALVLAFLTRPIVGKMEVYKLLALVVIAFVYSTPWDYFKLAHGVWGYCEGCVLFTVWLIPFEEYCFFILQTVITTLWSTLVFYPQLPLLRFLAARPGALSSSRLATLLPVLLFGALGLLGWHIATPNTPSFYLGSIMWWVSPVLMLQWGLAGRYIMRMGAGPVLTAILAPTFYLWFVDVVALNNGAWFIARGTKLDELELPMALPIEEATFFLVTNLMIVFGFLTWDRTVCMAENCAEGGRLVGSDVHVDTAQLVKRYIAAVFKSDDEISEKAVEDVSLSLRLITKGSKSFHLASTFFPPGVRQDIMQLYSWCRVCDDLVDDKLAQKNHAFVRQFFDNFLDSVYADDALAPSGSIRTSDPASSIVIRPAGERHLKNQDGDHLNELREVVVVGATPSESVLDKLLPFEKISSFRCIKRLVDKYHMKREELAELIDGFKLDMDMDRREVKIGTTDDLIHYSCCVAASVGVMCCRIFNIPSHRTDVYERARDMGIALQLTNIARDIVTDAKIGRVYVPLQWFESEQERQELLDHPWKNPGRLRQFAESLISLSEPYYRRAEEGVAMLPHEAQKPVMLGLRFYKEIGHIILKNPSYPERAHAPLMDKLAIALRVYFPPTYRDIGVALGYSLFLA